MTAEPISDTSRRVGRKMLWPDAMVAKFARHTFARIASVLEPGEDRTDFVRGAVERELKRRRAPKPEAFEPAQKRKG